MTMRFSRAAAIGALVVASQAAFAQRGADSTGRGGGRGGGGRGRGAIAIMTLTSPAFQNGGTIPVTHSQAGEERSPALTWAGAPDSAASFVLIVHDPNAPIQGGIDDMLHWMVWNIPSTARSLPEGIPHGSQMSDGMRQISASGPYYRGPAAPATGPVHNYLFELYALDAMLEVPAVGAAPPATRAAVLAAMAGHVRGKGVLVGTFRRAVP
jgi:Raf kinase inhibitor-like YbhB/YbcL family protein